MAELGAFFGNPNIQRQGARARALAAQRDVNTLADPRTYAIVQGLLGTAPDEMGFSVLNPDYEKIRKVAEPAFALGLLGQIAPMGKALNAPAAAIGKAVGPNVDRLVTQTLERGGLPAEMVKAMGTGTQSAMLPPSKFIGRPLEGLLSKVDVGGRIEEFGTDQRLVDIAKDITQKKGFIYSPLLKYANVDEGRAKRLADAYDKMENNPSNKAVKKAYDAMIEETMEQYEALRKKGYQFSFMPESGDIYGNPRNAINDIVQNQRLSVFPTEQGFGSLVEASQANPLLMKTGEKWGGKDVTVNDVFRGVHDVFGHGKYGLGFRARGEENAAQAHARMYSPEALPAVMSETRGQNSWVNFGPYGEFNRTASPAETIYAEQKAGLMPELLYLEGLLK